MPIELTDRPVGAEGAGIVGGAVGVKDPLAGALPIVDLALFDPERLPVTPAETFIVPDATPVDKLVFCL